MPYVYRYKDKTDNIVKYVGIIKSDSNFPKRFMQHNADEWAKNGDWTIEYFEVETATDAEALEAHFIDLYNTDAWYNKAKATWGPCSFAPMDFIWKEWSGWTKEQIKKSKERRLYWSDICSIDRKIQDLRQEINRLSDMYLADEKETEKEARRSVRAWVDDCFVFPYWFDSELKSLRHSYSLCDCFCHYQEYSDYVLEKCGEELAEFETLDDFIGALCSCKELNHNIHGGNLIGAIQKGTEDFAKYERVCFERDREASNMLARCFGGCEGNEKD